MIDKIQPAPLPNGVKGGFLKAMTTNNSPTHKLEMEALLAKHKAEIARLSEKHQKASKPTVRKPNNGK